MKLAIRKYRNDFIAILVLVVFAFVVGGVILSNQRFYLPSWVPVVGTDFFTVKAEFQTSQSVTPGQGQTVNIAGVKVGEISNVNLVDGRAVVTMKVKRKYADIHRDARLLLRPKTGLNDMIVEMDPGTAAARKVEDGGTLPVSSSQPNVNPDEILAVLDADTRDYLKLLLSGGAEGLRGQGKTLSSVLRRFEPTGRDIAKLSGLLSQRRRSLQRVIHSFQQISTELGSKDKQLAQLIDSSNAVFRSFATQERNLSRTIELLPGALDSTRSALGHVDDLSQNLGPALAALRPGARALGPSLRAARPFLKETTPVLRDQFRPFARKVRPTARTLRPAARDLAAVAPDLTTTFKSLNYLFNELAYNPPGKEEGFLFWLAWTNHLGASLFASQDAHGPLRRGLIMASCVTLSAIENTAKVQPQLSLLIQLLNAPSQKDVGC